MDTLTSVVHLQRRSLITVAVNRRSFAGYSIRWAVGIIDWCKSVIPFITYPFQSFILSAHQGIVGTCNLHSSALHASQTSTLITITACNWLCAHLPTRHRPQGLLKSLMKWLVATVESEGNADAARQWQEVKTARQFMAGSNMLKSTEDWQDADELYHSAVKPSEPCNGGQAQMQWIAQFFLLSSGPCQMIAHLFLLISSSRSMSFLICSGSTSSSFLQEETRISHQYQSIS